jgi:hypothetical protein
MSRLRSLTIAALAALALTAGADPNQGIVTVAYDGKTQGVFPVTIQDVDGKVQPLPPRETHYLEPGKHTFRLAPVFDDNTKMQRGNSHRSGDDSAAVLEIDVQAGKRYLIGAKVEGRKSAEWKPVVLRVEDTKS